jgi:hypothetical protein
MRSLGRDKTRRVLVGGIWVDQLLTRIAPNLNRGLGSSRGAAQDSTVKRPICQVISDGCGASPERRLPETRKGF